jgi:hypothetical protein
MSRESDIGGETLIATRRPRVREGKRVLSI